MDERARRRRRTRAMRDLALIALPLLVLMALGARFDLAQGTHGWLQRRFPGKVDEVFLALVLLAFGLSTFALFRWRDERRVRRTAVETEERHQALVEQMPAVLYTWDPRTRTGVRPVPYVSPQVETILGFTPEEWKADPKLWIRQIHPEDRDRVLRESGKADQTGEPFAIEYRHVKKDGTIVWVRDEALVVERDARGNPSLVQGIMYDVSERKHVEEHLRQAETRLRALVEQVPAVTYTWDARRRPGSAAAPYVSPQIEALLGVPHDEWQADPSLWAQRVHPDDRDRVLEEWDRAVDAGAAFRSEYRMRAKDGHEVWIRDEAVPVGSDDEGGGVYQGVMFDVTDRRLAEERLAVAEERFRTLVEQIPAMTFIEDPETGRNIYISPQIETILGYSAQEWRDDPDLWARSLHPDDRDRVVAENQADLGDSWSVDYRAIHVDGHVVWLHNDAILVRDHEGAPLYWQGLVFDITERKEAEERLREAESTYRTLVEQLPVVVYQDAIDETSTALYVSPQYERLFGYPPEARTSDPRFWIDHLHPGDREWVLERSRMTNETGEPFVAEYRFIAKDGRIVWVRDEAVVIRDAAGNPRFWQGVLLDVTERKQAEAALSRRDAVLEAVGFAAERFLREHEWEATLLDVLERLGTAADASRAYVFENETSEDGGPVMSLFREWLAPDVPSIDVPSNHRLPYAEGYARWEAALSSGHALTGIVKDLPEPERAGLVSEGVLGLALVPVFVGGEWWGFLGFDDCRVGRVWPTAEVEALRAAADTLGAAIDRARAERLRTETEVRYRSLVERMPAVTYVHDPDGNLTYVSPQIDELLGLEPGERRLGRDAWVESIHPDDRNRVVAEDGRTDETGEPFDIEYRQVRPDGRVIWVRDSAVLVRDDEDQPLYWQGVRLDITAQKEAEQQLREAESKYRALVEHIPAVLYVDPPVEDAPSVYVSPQIEEVVGCTQQEYLNSHGLWLELIHEDDRERVLHAYRQSLDMVEGWRIEYRVRRPDTGAIAWIRDESAFLFDGEGRVAFVQGVMFDVTERKLAEQALRDSERREREAAERLRALDEMKNTFLAAVSHELRSPLTSILGLALTLEQTELPDEDRGDLLGRLATNARKLDRLLKDLLDIDRLNRGIVTPSYRPTDLGQLVRRTVENLDVLGERRLQVQTDSIVVPVDAAKVERIVENLLANAARHTGADRTIWVRVWAEADGAVVAVEDDGPGVPPELQREIFEPFRQGPTASPHSPGTGIGLSLVAMLTDLHGGSAWVQEREGGGASFRVFLPFAPPDGPGGLNGDGAPALHTADAG